MLSFTIWNVKTAVTCECGRVVPFHKLIYFNISKLKLYFPYCFHVLFAVLFAVYFKTVLSMFSFFCYWSHSKASVVNQTIQLCCYYYRPSIGQSNVQAVTAENEKQYTLSNIIQIKFEKFFFLWGLLWRRCS